MKTIYLENFKGFTKAFLPLKEVNFFVGENSTGKTAILNLLNILSKPNFWVDPNFNNEQVELGYFEEIAKKNQGSDKYFRLGLEYSEEENSNDKTKFILFQFKDKDGIPTIANFKLLTGNITILVNITSKTIKYQSKNNTFTDFQQWIEDESIGSSFKKLNLPSHTLKQLPFGVLKSVIISQIHEEEKEMTFGISIRTPFKGDYISFAPIRAKAKRTYDSYKQKFSPEGEHIPFILRNIFNNSSTKNSEIIKAIQKFGKESSLFDEIKISKLGRTKVSPFEIDVLYDNVPVKITNVGYGVSQILPMLIEMLTSSNDFFSLQQPEVHLHPKAQAAFGELIYTSFSSKRNRFIIETHSDFMINRFRYELNKAQNDTSPQSQVVFFEREEQGTKFTCMELSNDGRYPEDIPSSYMSFFLDEEFKMLEI